MNFLGHEYVVNEFGRNHIYKFLRKRNAMKFARAMAYQHGNDWIVVRHDRKGRTKRLCVIGN